MARTREFDEDEVLQKAMEFFWEQGYAKSSIRGLVKHTGLAHAGMYNTFGDKDALYERALRLYIDSFLFELFKPLESADADINGIRQIFTILGEGSYPQGLCNGCFVVNTAIEFKDDSNQIGKDVIYAKDRMKRAFANALTNAVALGQIGGHTNIEQLSSLMVTTFFGCSTLIRFGESDMLIKQTADAMLALITN